MLYSTKTYGIQKLDNVIIDMTIETFLRQIHLEFPISGIIKQNAKSYQDIHGLEEFALATKAFGMQERPDYLHWIRLRMSERDWTIQPLPMELDFARDAEATGPAIEHITAADATKEGRKTIRRIQ